MGKFSGKKCRLLSMLWLTGTFFFVELIVGYVTNSMALVADSFHMLSDVAALVIAFLSVKMSPKKWSKNTFGWARAEVLGALVNAVFLVALCFSITVEAVQRFIKIEIIHNAKLLVAVGTLGLVLNIVGLFLFHEHGSSHGHTHGGVPPPANVRHLTELVNSNADMALGHATPEEEETDEMVPPKIDKLPSKQTPRANADPGNLNMKGVFLHVLSDALGSLIVVCSALVVWLTDWEYKYYIDPALSIVLVILILASVWPLLRESALILLQTVPTHIQVDAIQRRLLEKVDGVLAVHEFHVWQLAGDRIIASAHIRCRNLSEYMKIAEKVKEFFHNEGIHSTTIQPEFVELPLDGNEIISGASAEAPCALHCPPNDLCHNATCCGPNQQKQNTPSPAVTPYMCRQRNMGSRTESMHSNLNASSQGNPTARNLDALECGSLLPSPMMDSRLTV
ncbi:zinc/cadmium resistance protein isoform X1 [Maniola jurtina]|uniref:zinc/cadmium resistance protein isoform X1 n=1 Tax=Maniola jurtina TaxID=191418 RepID=UPI001E6866A1|nr:zinc/cadmium resistance protein isoform X1 [Maniola jurtina]XP_045763557.1 zinc/cadmium resistance protein isoform X1 [Maniola jurtina]